MSLETLIRAKDIQGLQKHAEKLATPLQQFTQLKYGISVPASTVVVKKQPLFYIAEHSYEEAMGMNLSWNRSWLVFGAVGLFIDLIAVPFTLIFGSDKKIFWYKEPFATTKELRKLRKQGKEYINLEEIKTPEQFFRTAVHEYGHSVYCKLNRQVNLDKSEIFAYTFEDEFTKWYEKVYISRRASRNSIHEQKRGCEETKHKREPANKFYYHMRA